MATSRGLKQRLTRGQSAVQSGDISAFFTFNSEFLGLVWLFEQGHNKTVLDIDFPQLEYNTGL